MLKWFTRGRLIFQKNSNTWYHKNYSNQINFMEKFLGGFFFFIALRINEYFEYCYNNTCIICFVDAKDFIIVDYVQLRGG
jgi:hypothetical protein